MAKNETADGGTTTYNNNVRVIPAARVGLSEQNRFGREFDRCFRDGNENNTANTVAGIYATNRLVRAGPINALDDGRQK